MIYNELYNFCKVRDIDRKKYSNRAKFIVELLTRLGIEHKVIRTKSTMYMKYFYNIYVFGSSDKYLSAHYDVVDPTVDNANDNSASVINCIAYKVKNPSINLLILDGEEPPFMGAGSNLAAKYLKRLGRPVKWIFNLELTGAGKTFFIDNAETQLSKCIQEHFPEAFVTGTPFNDAMIFRKHGFESNVVTCVNTKEEPDVPTWWEKEQMDKETVDYSEDENGDFVPDSLEKVQQKEEEPEEVKMRTVPDMSPLYHSHGPADSVDKMSIEDMRNFVDNVVDVVVKSC